MGALGSLDPKPASVAAQVEGSLAMHWPEWHLRRVDVDGMDRDGDHSRV